MNRISTRECFNKYYTNFNRLSICYIDVITNSQKQSGKGWGKMKYGYARVSTHYQDLGGQLRQL